MEIRTETPSDIDAITFVTEQAFLNHPISKQTEQFIIKALRAAGVLTISLVAINDGRIVGHIAFSPIIFSDGTKDWYGLGPVSVLPEFQKRGIGSKLLKQGIDLLKSKGAKGVALVGDPAFYQRFGFKNYPQMIYPGIPQQYFMGQSFTHMIPEGTVLFHESFTATS